MLEMPDETDRVVALSSTFGTLAGRAIQYDAQHELYLPCVLLRFFRFLFRVTVLSVFAGLAI